MTSNKLVELIPTDIQAVAGGQPDPYLNGCAAPQANEPTKDDDWCYDQDMKEAMYQAGGPNAGSFSHF